MSLKRTVLAPAGAALLVPALALVYSTWRPGETAAAAPPTDDRTIEHVLNRLGYGPRPDDIEKLRHTGVNAYIEQQLHPERVDDAAIEARLAPLKTLEMSQSALAREIFIPAQQEKRQRKELQARSDSAPPKPNGAAQRMDVSPALLKARLVIAELSEQKLLRAIYSERQLQEVLTDFWFNHFNVDARKGAIRFMLTEYERDAIRPHVLGTVPRSARGDGEEPRDALLPRQLDERRSERAASARPQTGCGRAVARAGLARRGAALAAADAAAAGEQAPRRGLNENYARELMELHTLGVDGGYTQKDVTEVARAFTGWTIDRPAAGRRASASIRASTTRARRSCSATDQSRRRDQRRRTGARHPGAHPSTARFIATKLARRFVSDTPPPALVDRMAAKRFRETEGDLREVMRTHAHVAGVPRAGRATAQR